VNKTNSRQTIYFLPVVVVLPVVEVFPVVVFLMVFFLTQTPLLQTPAALLILQGTPLLSWTASRQVPFPSQRGMDMHPPEGMGAHLIPPGRCWQLVVQHDPRELY